MSCLGYTITINQRGMNALRRLDLSTEVEEHARQPLSFHMMRYNGHSLIRLPPQDRGPGRVFPVLRETLHDLLLLSLRNPEKLICWNSKVERYNIDQQGAFIAII